jgi:hypothetical protein
MAYNVDLKWFEDHAPEGTKMPKHMLRPISLRKTPIETPIIAEITSIIGKHEGRRGKGHEHEQNIRGPPRAR